MPLTNPNKIVTEERLSEFYGQILPYMGGMPEMLANKFSKGDLYSTDEKMIGVWIDNKPLYQKTVTTGGNVPSGATLIQRTTQTGYDTILYTKTTDSAIAIGSESDYDSTEKIVGTWFGEDLWQKTFDVTSVADGNIITLDSNCYIKNISGSYFPTSNDQVVPASFWYAASAFITTYCGAHNIVKTKTSGYTNAPGKITLQYTKTS